MISQVSWCLLIKQKIIVWLYFKKTEANDQVGHLMLPERIQSFPKIETQNMKYATLGNS